MAFLNRHIWTWKHLLWKRCLPRAANWIQNQKEVELIFQFCLLWKSLVKRSESPLGIAVCPVTMFCISWVTRYVASDAPENLICWWNYHRISGSQGCVPVENMSLPAQLIPTVNWAVKMYEERGGSLTCKATFGTDPLVIRSDLIKSHERLYLQPSGEPNVQNQFSDHYINV